MQHSARERQRRAPHHVRRRRIWVRKIHPQHPALHAHRTCKCVRPADSQRARASLRHARRSRDATRPGERIIRRRIHRHRPRVQRAFQRHRPRTRVSKKHTVLRQKLPIRSARKIRVAVQIPLPSRRSVRPRHRSPDHLQLIDRITPKTTRRNHHADACRPQRTARRRHRILMPQPRRKTAARRRIIVAEIIKRPQRFPRRVVVRIQTLQRVKPHRPVNELLVRPVTHIVPIIAPPRHRAHMTRAAKSHAAKRRHCVGGSGDPRLVVAIKSVVQIQRAMMRDTQLRPKITRANRRSARREIHRDHCRVRSGKVHPIIPIPAQRETCVRRNHQIRAPRPRRQPRPIHLELINRRTARRNQPQPRHPRKRERQIKTITPRTARQRHRPRRHPARAIRRRAHHARRPARAWNHQARQIRRRILQRINTIAPVRKSPRIIPPKSDALNRLPRIAPRKPDVAPADPRRRIPVRPVVHIWNRMRRRKRPVADHPIRKRSRGKRKIARIIQRASAVHMRDPGGGNDLSRSAHGD